jgi:hypothetical protein
MQWPWGQAVLTCAAEADRLDSMTMKEKVVLAVPSLLDDASVEDAAERLLLLLTKIDRGLARADAGQPIFHAQGKE